MKNKGLLYAIIASLVLSSMLTACADTEGSDTTASNTQAIASQTTVETDKSTENATDAVTDTQATTAPETDKMTDAPATNAPVEDTKAPADDKVYASKEEYPDDWGISDGIIRAKGDIFFWEDSRVMHTAPKGISGPERWHLLYPDEENDQFIFYIKKNKNEWDYYSFVKGKVYKLNSAKIIFNWNDDTGPIYWVEEDGTAKSFNVRSEEYDEVYIEAEGVRSYSVSLNAFKSMDGTKRIPPNKENILAKLEVIS